MTPVVNTSLVETGVPMPIKQRQWEAFSTLNTLEVGQSLIVPGISVYRASAAVCYRYRRYGRKYSCRTLPDKSGVRIWRLS